MGGFVVGFGGAHLRSRRNLCQIRFVEGAEVMIGVLGSGGSWEGGAGLIFK